MMNDRGMIASFPMSPLSIITNLEHTSQFKLVKDVDLKRDNDLLINKTKPVTLYDILLTIHDTDKKFELEGDFLKTITIENYNIDR